MVPVAIDLFCGAGGLSEGFHQAGYKIAYACDFDEQAVATFSFNHPNVLVKQQDINKLTSDQIFSEAKLTRGEVDIVMGGPPCQGFSLAGNRLPDDPKNHLVLEFKRLIKEIRPRIVLMENVPGILSMKGGEVVEILGQEFNDLGYRVAQGVLNAADFGVPQARPRFILIGVTDCGDASLPSPTHQKNGDIAQGNFFSNKPLHSHLTVNEALSDLPRLEQGEGSEVLKHSGIYMNGYQKERRGHRRQGEIYNHRATRHSTTIVQRYSLIPQGFSNSCLPDEIRTKKVNVYRLSEFAFSYSYM